MQRLSNRTVIATGGGSGIGKGGGKAMAVHCDVTVEEQIQATVKRAVAEFGGISAMDDHT